MSMPGRKEGEEKNIPVLPMDLMFFGPGEYLTSNLFKLEGKPYLTVTERLSGLILSGK